MNFTMKLIRIFMIGKLIRFMFSLLLPGLLICGLCWLGASGYQKVKSSYLPAVKSYYAPYFTVFGGNKDPEDAKVPAGPKPISHPKRK